MSDCNSINELAITKNIMHLADSAKNEYDINNRFGIIFEPIFDMNIFPSDKALEDDPFGFWTVRFYNIGIRFGFIMH
ncbi:MAG: hypothetical protein ACTSP6_10410 [Promethearchaeota archaeon]